MSKPRGETDRELVRWMLSWSEHPGKTLKHWQTGKMQLSRDRTLELAYETIDELYDLYRTDVRPLTLIDRARRWLRRMAA